MRRGFEEWYDRLRLSQRFCAVFFAARDGRLYMADVGMIVRPATPDEARNAVENAKEWESDLAMFTLEDRIKTLDGYLGKLGA